MADTPISSLPAATTVDGTESVPVVQGGTTKKLASGVVLNRANHTGTQSADTVTDGTTNKAYTAAEKTKLAGVAAAATANATDAALRDRSTHTGTQAASTVTGLSTVATSGAYADLSGKPTIPAAYTDAQAQAANASALASKANIADIGATGTATGDALKAAIDAEGTAKGWGSGATSVDYFAEVMKTTATSRLDTPGNVAGAWMNPAATYATTCYVRDSFWTQIGLGSPAISRALLSRFGSYIGTGSTPNRAPLFLQQDASHNITAGPWFSYDDTNALLLIWEAWHRQKFSAAVLSASQITSLVAGITANLTADNWWKDESAVSTLGFGWLDSLTTPGPTTLTSALNQGLTWVALSCAANQLGATVSGTVLAGLLTNYQSLYQTDHVATYKDRGAGTYPDWIDVVSIMPEFWAKYLLSQAMLTDAQVAAHMDRLFASNLVTMPGAGRAFKCIARRDGTYLAATLWKNFIPGSTGQPPGGVYQNGGSWLLHDFFALAVGRLHGYANNDLDAMWRERIAAEFAIDLTSHEQINTSAAGAFPIGTCGPTSFAYGWNAGILGLEKFAGLSRAPGPRAAAAPMVPTKLAAAAGNATVTLGWTAPADPYPAITSYNVYRGATSGAETLLGTSPTASYTDSAVTNGTTYYYRVAAVNSAGVGVLSAEVSATPATGGAGTSLPTLQRTVTDGATTLNSTALTSASANFTSADVGRAVSGAGLAAGTLISSVTNGTTVVLSANATATATGVTVQIGAAPAQWFKADTLALTDGASVPTWTDSSGNGNNATQATAATQPIYKTNIVNSLPIVRFYVGSVAMYLTTAATWTSEQSIFVVAKQSANSSTPVGSVNGAGLSLQVNSSGNLVLNKTDTALLLTAGAVPSTQFSVLAAVTHSNSETLTVNGTATTGSTSPNVSAGTIQVGADDAGSSPMKGDIAEIIIYPRTMPTADRRAVEAYLAAKYAITVV